MKPWYFSKTIWFNLITGLLVTVSAVWPNASFATQWIATNRPFIDAGWAGLNVILRLVTKEKVQLFD